MLSLILVTVEAKFLLFSLESLNKYFFAPSEVCSTLTSQGFCAKFQHSSL